MTVVDTSCIIRFVTRDLKGEAGLVKKLFESEEILLIPDVVFPEVEYVLTGDYEFPRVELLKVFRFLLSLPKAIISPEIKIALNIFENSNLDMADCIIAAYAKGGKLASFDKKLLRISGEVGYWKE